MSVCSTVCASPSRDGPEAFITLDREADGAKECLRGGFPASHLTMTGIDYLVGKTILLCRYL